MQPIALEKFESMICLENQDGGSLDFYDSHHLMIDSFHRHDCHLVPLGRVHTCLYFLSVMERGAVHHCPFPSLYSIRIPKELKKNQNFYIGP